MILSLIVAVSENGIIGTENDLPWHLPADLKFFKRTTLGHPIIIGRKTFESFGGRPLPRRRNLILTRNKAYSAEGAEVFQSLDDALKTCAAEDEVFISGGAQIYEMALPMCTRLYYTDVHTQLSGETRFPDLDWNEWILVNEEFREKDEKNHFSLTWKLFHRV